MNLFIVRHGETDWNRAGRFQGQLDIPLNDAGRGQAAAAAERLRGAEFEAVYTSPLSRALETARIIADAARCGPLFTDPDLMEICHGDWEGLTIPQAERRNPELFRLWRTQPDHMTMPGPGGESLNAVLLRASAAAERAVKRHTGAVLIVTHGVVVQTLICHFLRLPLLECWNIKVPNCAVTRIENIPDAPRLTRRPDAEA